MTIVNFEHLENCLPDLKSQWNKSVTSSHSFVMVEDMLLPSKSQEIIDSFPDDSWPQWDHVGDSLQFKKLSCERIDVFPENLRMLVHELNSGPILRWLERLTGVNDLLPDPHLWGGGLHLTEPGGYLWPHTDFLQGRTPNLMRVLNMILFVHPRWDKEMGGHFQLWQDGKSPMRSIVPVPGRCVIFKTDARSIHGVSQVTGAVPRRSIALFYYMVVDKVAIPLDRTAGWQLSLTPSGSVVGGMRQMAARALMSTSFGLKRIAIALNAKAEAVANFHRS